MLTGRFEQALVLAAQLHARQERKGSGIPYVAHLLGVSSLVLEHGGGEDEAIAGLLHDAVEDQGGMATLARIRREFGDDVAAMVAECSDSHGEPRSPWRQRKESYLEAIPDKRPGSRLVSCADKLNNARAILADYRAVGESLWGRFSGGRDGTLWYYRTLALAFAAAGPAPLAAELARVVAEIDTLVARS